MRCIVSTDSVASVGPAIFTCLVVVLRLASAVAQDNSFGSVPATQALTVCAGAWPLNSSRLSQHCVQVDVCTQKSHRGDDVLLGEWTHRSNSALRVPHDDSTGVFARYNIDGIYVPRGVDVELCEPDFAALRESQRYVCNAQTIEIVQLACDPTDATDLWYNHYGLCAYTPGRFPSSTQMLRFRFKDTWGCHSEASPGFRLSGSSVPNQLLPCDAVPHGQYTAQCDFECDAGYQLVDGVCRYQCAVHMKQACLPDEYATGTCSADDGLVWYDCSSCITTAGTAITAFSIRSEKTLDTCMPTPCAAGQYGVDGECIACAEHFYTTEPGQAVCTQCAWGKHMPVEGGTACLECFTAPPDEHGALCGQGQQLYMHLQDVEDYFRDTNSTLLSPLTDTLLHEFCAQGFACLPCRPGQFEQLGVCSKCAVGTYQPHFESSSCFVCSAGQTTARLGTTSSEECICEPGFA